MTLAETIMAMVEAGCSPEQVAAVARHFKAKDDAAAEIRREKERLKKSAQRAKRRVAVPECPPMSPDVPMCPQGQEGTPSRAYKERARADGNPNPSLRSGLLVTPLPSEGPQGGRSRSRSAGSALPDDWSPPEELFAYGADLGLTRAQTGEIVEGMRLWAHANRNRPIARKADWMATMKGAIRRDAAKAKARAGPATHRNGLGAIAAKLWGSNDARETEIAGETALRLPLNGEPKRGPDAGHAGVVSGNAVGLLIEGSFKRM